MSDPHRTPWVQTRAAQAVRTFVRTLGLHGVLAAVSFTLALPFVWMVMTSLSDLSEIGLGSWVPSEFKWENYREVFRYERQDISVEEFAGTSADRPKGIPFARYYWNSVFVASWVTFLQILTSSLAAFSFARLRWPGRDRVFMLYLATMMLPGLVMMIPNYQIMITLGLVDSLAGLIIPASFSAFGTFLLRQFMLTIPTSLDEAAEIDGANKWRLFWDVILPLSRPGLIVLAIFTFIGNYHSFFWPLVMIRSQHKYTLPIGLLYFDSSRGTETTLLMAAVTMSVVPMIALFILLQKYLVKGIQLGAVKG